MKTFIAYIEFDPETNLYIGTVPGIPGAHTQGATLDERQANLKEVLEL
jgi:predicted RNase H-like HicB family nuclease